MIIETLNFISPEIAKVRFQNVALELFLIPLTAFLLPQASVAICSPARQYFSSIGNRILLKSTSEIFSSLLIDAIQTLNYAGKRI